MRIAYATPLPEFEADPDPRFLRPTLAAGYLAAYALRIRGPADEHDLVTAHELADLPSAGEIADRLLRSHPHVIALTTFVWNREEVRRTICALRSREPQVQIVLGGPEIAFSDLPRQLQFDADWICTGEGEIPFVGLLKALSSSAGCTEHLPGMLCMRRVRPMDLPRGSSPVVQSLDTIPSPYLMNLLRVPQGGWVDLETLRGCPFSCRFCLYGKEFESMRYFSEARVLQDVEAALHGGAGYLYFMDPTFNLPKDRCSRLCRAISARNEDSRLSIYVEARAEILDEILADDFQAAGITNVEVGLQSTDRDALRLMKRGLGEDRFIRGCRLLRERGIEVDIGMIVGLPGDDENSVRRTAELVFDEALGHLSVHLLQVLPGSQFAQLAGPLGLQHDQDAPYFVHSTPTLPESRLQSLYRELEIAAAHHNDRYLAGLSR